MSFARSHFPRPGGGGLSMPYQITSVSAAKSSRRPPSSSAFTTAKRGGGALCGRNSICFAAK